MESIKNDQLNLILHADINRSDVHEIVRGIVKKEMQDVITRTYDINRLCREVLINEVLAEKMKDLDQKLVDTIKTEVEKLLRSQEIANAVKSKLTGYGSQVLNVAISEMQPYINGRVAEIVKESDMKGVMTIVSQKISDRLFNALRDEGKYED